MLSYAVGAATVEPGHIVVVVGHGRDQVEAHLTRSRACVDRGADERAGRPAMRSKLRSAELPDLTVR